MKKKLITQYVVNKQ